MQDGLLPSRVSERDAAELDATRDAGRFDRVHRVSDGRLGVDNLLETCRAGCRAWHEDHHERRQHDGEEDLQNVGEEGDQVAHRQLPAVDQASAKPNDDHARHVHDRQQGGYGQREYPVHPQRGPGQVRIGRLKPVFLKLGAIEGSDDAYAGDLLPHHLVDAVDLDLQRLK